MFIYLLNSTTGKGYFCVVVERDHNLTRVISDAYNELVKCRSPEQLKYHKFFTDANDDEHLEEIDFNFVEGFKLGLLIGIECMED